MLKRIGAWAAANLIAATGAWAQPAPAAPPAKPDPAASEAAAAMERARRQAAGPLRVILEASKTRRRPGDEPPEPPAPRAVAAPTRPAPANAPTAVIAAPTALRPSVVTGEPANAPRLAPAPAVTAAVQPATAAGTPAVITEITLRDEALQKPAITVPEPGLQPVGAAVAPAVETALPPLAVPTVAPVARPAPPVAAVPAPAAPPLAVPGERPRLINRVDPELNERTLAELGRNAVVQVDLTLRTDGTVAQVKPVGALPRGVARTLTQAMEQWRFAPLSDVRVHRIELVFNAE